MGFKKCRKSQQIYDQDYDFITLFSFKKARFDKMNPRNHPKADTYILAWKGILHAKELNRLTMQRKLRQKLINETQAIIRGLGK